MEPRNKQTNKNHWETCLFRAKAYYKDVVFRICVVGPGTDRYVRAAELGNAHPPTHTSASSHPHTPPHLSIPPCLLHSQPPLYTHTLSHALIPATYTTHPVSPQTAPTPPHPCPPTYIHHTHTLHTPLPISHPYSQPPPSYTPMSPHVPHIPHTLHTATHPPTYSHMGMYNTRGYIVSQWGRG